MHQGCTDKIQKHIKHHKINNTDALIIHSPNISRP